MRELLMTNKWLVREMTVCCECIQMCVSALKHMTSWKTKLQLLDFVWI